MGFFKKFQLGKVFGGAVRGFLTAGPKGAIAGAALAATKATFNAATSRASHTMGSGGPGQFNSIQTSFGGRYQQPGTLRVSNYDVPVPVASRGGMAMTGPVYNILLRLADKLGVVIRNPNAVVSTGRNLLAKLVRFTRATPGLTILSMLANLGISAFEANQLIAWYSTAGKRRKRIRVTNVKALKRSVRRLEGFRKLASRVETVLAGRGSTAGRRRVSRCRSCRKSPCAC